MKKLILSIATVLAIASLQSFQVPSASAQSATVTYVGAKEEGVVFELKLDIGNARNTQFTITDRAGEVVYEESIREKNLVKRFILPCEENVEYNFAVRSGSLRYEKHFMVNRKQVTTIHVAEVK